MSHTAVGLPSHEDEFQSWLVEMGADRSEVRMFSAGSVLIGDVGRWIGVPPPAPDMVSVNLRAPEACEGEVPHWLEFRPGARRPSPSEPVCYWTSDLIAVQIERA